MEVELVRVELFDDREAVLRSCRCCETVEEKVLVGGSSRPRARDATNSPDQGCAAKSRTLALLSGQAVGKQASLLLL